MSPDSNDIATGDFVKIELDVDVFKLMQPGWRDEMIKVL